MKERKKKSYFHANITHWHVVRYAKLTTYLKAMWMSQVSRYLKRVDKQKYVDFIFSCFMTDH